MRAYAIYHAGAEDFSHAGFAADLGDAKILAVRFRNVLHDGRPPDINVEEVDVDTTKAAVVALLNGQEPTISPVEQGRKYILTKRGGLKRVSSFEEDWS